MFKRLKELDPAGKTVEIPMPYVNAEPKAVYVGRYVGLWGNQDELSQALVDIEQSTENKPALERTKARMAVVREKLAAASFVELRNFLDDEGNPVPSTVENAKQLFQQLPTELLIDVYNTLSEPDSFRPPLPDPMETAKNSVSGSPGN